MKKYIFEILMFIAFIGYSYYLVCDPINRPITWIEMIVDFALLIVAVVSSIRKIDNV